MNTLTINFPFTLNVEDYHDAMMVERLLRLSCQNNDIKVTEVGFDFETRKYAVMVHLGTLKDNIDFYDEISEYLRKTDEELNV